MTVLELLEATTRYLAQNGVASPRLTIELMLAEVMQKTRLQLYLEFDRVVPDEVRDRLRPLVKRRAEGEPLEYVLGVTTFAGCRVRVTPDVLIPRPETEILLTESVGVIDPKGRPVIDVGTGSGILALALAKKFPEVQFFGVDRSEAALAVARGNAEGLSNVQFLAGDLLEAEGLPARAQMIVANLPYIPTKDLSGLAREVRHEPRSALDGGADGLDLIRRLISQSAGRTQFLGLEFGDGQSEALRSLCQQAGYGAVRTLTDFTSRPRILIAEAGAAVV
jgi:release factor glutamine methyltransferase